MQNTRLPSTHPPQYTVSSDVPFTQIHQLPKITHAYAGYLVIGAGKIGIDACLWLLGHGVPPEKIQWIIPRDPWLLDRANQQFCEAFLERSLNSLADQVEAVANATSFSDLFVNLEACGELLRLDPEVEPTTYHCATVTQQELQLLRQIKGIVRLGRVRSIEQGKAVLDHGTIPMNSDHLYIDCSASGIPSRPTLPIFEDDRITLQWVRTCQPAFSAAVHCSLGSII